MISEGLCDIEKWSNDAEDSALHQRKELHSKLYSNIFFFYQINAALVRIQDYF